MAINPYLFFPGNCREAVSYYADVFSTQQPSFMTFGEAPVPVHPGLSDEDRNLILHTNLTIAGTLLMFSDIMPGMPYEMGNSFSLVVMTRDEDLLRKAFARLAEEGTVTLPLETSFFSPLYGMLKDKFGVSWQFSLGNEANYS